MPATNSLFRTISIISIVCILAVLPFDACKKDSSSGKLDTYTLAGINNTGGISLICYKLDSGVVHATPVNCFNQYATVFDPFRKYYGYIGCDTVFRLINPKTGSLVNSFKVPGMLTIMAVDSADNALIGYYYVINYGPDTTATDHIAKVNLGTGEVMTDNPVDFGLSSATYWPACYNQDDKLLLLQVVDYSFKTVNTRNGTVTSSISYNYPVLSSAYRRDSSDLVAVTYSYADQKRYLSVIDLVNGRDKHRVAIVNQDEYINGSAAWDSATNSMVLANSGGEIIFIDIATGITIRKYKLGRSLSEIKFWK